MALNKKKKRKRRIRNPRLRALIALAVVLAAAVIIGAGVLAILHTAGGKKSDSKTAAETQTLEVIKLVPETETSTESAIPPAAESETEEENAGETESQSESQTGSQDDAEGTGEVISETISWNDSWEYAGFSKVHDSSVTLYHSGAANRNNIVVAVNAGHGSYAAQLVKTQCHPDGSVKVTGGSTAAGSTTAVGASGGTSLTDGTSEGTANLKAAIILKDTLLEAGYDVLMIREEEDCSLDNIARTVYANNNADCHIAIHYDSTESDKGLFCINVPDNAAYRSMEPVASHYKEHNALCEDLVQGEQQEGVKIYSTGLVALDLTQTSYSTVPSVDIEIGDRISSYTADYHQQVANGIRDGLDLYFGISR